MRHLARIVSMLAVSFLVGCGPVGTGSTTSESVGHAAPTEPRALEDLAPLVTFGWRDADDASLSDVERTYGGGALGNIGGVGEGPSGSLYVLDRAWNKIVVFRQDGTYDRLILGGVGQGPGEFQVPRGLSISPGGNVGVLDESRRVTVFSPAGDVLRVVDLDARLPLDFALGDRSVWVLHSTPEDGSNALLRYDLESGAQLEASGLANDTIANWMAHGESGAIALDGESLIWALARTGIVRRVQRGVETEVGQPLFPDIEPQAGETPTGVPLHWVGEGVHAVATAPHAVWILHRRMTGQMGDWTNEYLLTRLDLDLDNPQYYSFGSRRIWAAGFDVSRDGTALYVATDEPYPRVEKYTIPQ